MPIPTQDIDVQLATLDSDIPRLLQENPGEEFWIEILERAEAITQQVAMTHHCHVMAQLETLLLRHGLIPPSGWR